MYKNLFKRLFDILLSIMIIPFAMVLIIIFSPIIYLTDKGPVFYCGKRIGKNGVPFKMIKFRSMYVNSPDIRLKDGSTFNGNNDPRVTKIGKFLRETSLDEVPQIFNVLIGQMSLVGPRPDPIDWLDKYPEDAKCFLSIRPGITGYSQAYYRNNADANEKIRNDVFYANNLSIIMDIKIIIKTIAIVLKRKNTFKNITKETKAIEEIEQFNKKKV